MHFHAYIAISSRILGASTARADPILLLGYSSLQAYLLLSLLFLLYCLAVFLQNPR